jgi:hypothetical protein
MDSEVYNDNGTKNFRTPSPRKHSILGFNDCVKFNVFKKTGTTGNLITLNSIQDTSLLFLTKNNELLNSFDLKLKFDDIVAEKKLKESKDYKKTKYENVLKKLNENRNPNIKNLLKDLTKAPVESTIKKLQEGYNNEIDNVFNNQVESLIKSASRGSAKLASSGSKKSSILESSSLFENKITEIEKVDENEDEIFLTDGNIKEEREDDDDKEDEIRNETEEENDDVNSNGFSDDYSDSDKDDEPADKNILANFEEKYAHLLSEDAASETKSSSTDELMQDEDRLTGTGSKKTKKSKKTDETPILPPIIDNEQIAREMRLTLFNSINPSESSMNHLNSRLNDMRQIHLPSFQAQFHQVCQYGDDSRIVKLITQV